MTVAWGRAPAVLVVDFSEGFCDPGSTLGANLDAEVEATARLLEAARARAVPVLFTTIAFEDDLSDAGRWPSKIPGLADLRLGTSAVQIDARLGRRTGEPVVVKKGASAFFGTNLASLLVSRGVDTVVLCGATTSGCVRATAVDLMQHGFGAVVPRSCVGDRARAPHEASLFDVQAKYGDVTDADTVLRHLDNETEATS